MYLVVYNGRDYENSSAVLRISNYSRWNWGSSDLIESICANKIRKIINVKGKVVDRIGDKGQVPVVELETYSWRSK